jgi:hypothetical protein
MVEAQLGGIVRYATSIGVLVATLAVVGFGILSLLPHQPDPSLGFSSLKELASAYLRVQPGRTRASQLAGMGFDTATPNAEVLSYLGVIERFMPSDTVKFDHLDEALQNCLEARDRCTALVFKQDEVKVQSAGMFSLFGIGSAKAATASPEVTLIVQDGRVAYKMIRGVPLPPPAHRATVTAAVTAPPIAYRSAAGY